MTTLPKRRTDTGSDDIQTIDQDIGSLVQKFLAPIDEIRSFSKPSASFTGDPKEPFQGLKTNSFRPLESRVHAFFRYIGFPVAVENEFYNPGFDPQGNGFLGRISGVYQKRKKINEKFANADFLEIVNAREEWPENVRNIFSRQDFNSSLYAILLSTAFRQFQTLQDGVGPFEKDEQNIEVSTREFIANDFLNDNEISPNDVQSLTGLIGSSFTSGRHILKPFIVDPRIDLTVMPDISKIAVPFLIDSNSLLIEENSSVKRPGIELIIRERLRNSNNEDSAYLETLNKIANNEVSPNELIVDTRLGISINTRQIRNTAEAILDNNEIDSSSVTELGGITTVQVKMISDLVKLLKGLVFILKDSKNVINNIKEKINWIPIPNPEGPEFGNNQAILAVNNVSSKLNLIDRNIKSLQIRKLAGERQITERVGLGAFASPFSTNTNTENVINLDEELSQLIGVRNKLADLAFRAMGNIELIVGEASGLGLIDVISIYIALWAMDEESLISMLDEASFERLVTNFSDLVVGAAARRRDSGQPLQPIQAALENFENKLKNVLTFVDREFARQDLAPTEEEGGTIS